MMFTRKTDTERRRAIGRLLLGGAAVVALPGHWVRPVVESVILPAHAQATGCSTLVISGNTVGCANPSSGEFTYFQVDDTGPCPLLLSSTTESTYPLLVSELILVPDPDAEGFGVRVMGTSTYWIIENCSTTPSFTSGSAPVPSSFSSSFLALSGATWNISFTVTGGLAGITYSDIVLSPV
jgi:hypothetical protein